MNRIVLLYQAYRDRKQCAAERRQWEAYRTNVKSTTYQIGQANGTPPK